MHALHGLRIAALTGLIGIGAACSNSGAGYRPLVDGTRAASFNTDLDACQALARSRSPITADTGTAVLMGAAVGAALGTAEGDTAEGAVAGAIGGVLADTARAPNRRQTIVVDCMRQRGHRVVG